MIYTMRLSIYNVFMVCLIYMNATEYTYNGLRIGGWHGDYDSIMSKDTYECSGVPGASDC